jgi:hypothetical protein
MKPIEKANLKFPLPFDPQYDSSIPRFVVGWQLNLIHSSIKKEN